MYVFAYLSWAYLYKIKKTSPEFPKTRDYLNCIWHIHKSEDLHININMPYYVCFLIPLNIPNMLLFKVFKMKIVVFLRIPSFVNLKTEGQICNFFPPVSGMPVFVSSGNYLSNFFFLRYIRISASFRDANFRQTRTRSVNFSTRKAIIRKGSHL